MQRFGGLLLMLIGTVSLGGYLYLPSSGDDAAELAEVTRISVAPSHPIRPDSTMRVFAPASPVFRDAVTRNSHTASDRPATTSAWTTVVTPGHSRRAVLRSAEPGDSATRYELARDLQRELKRAGCYGGAITGVWSPATKRAMSAFLERANASLPIKAPDYILLSLVQSHDEIACTEDCPTGQTLDRAGRCMPNAVVAQSAKRSNRPEGTFAVADPSARVAVAPAEQLPWLDRNGRSLVTPLHRSAPPPGMMSMGGPAVPPEQASAANGASTGTGSHVSVEPDRHMPLPPPAGSVADTNGSRLAALTAEDGTAGEAAIAEDANPDSLAVAKPEKRRHVKRARNWQERPKHHNRYAGRRRGEPRPGTMRYNLVQALGGIY